MKKVVSIILCLFLLGSLLPFIIHADLTSEQAAVMYCQCYKCMFKAKPKPPAIDGWSAGEWITYRKQLPHGGCSGSLTFNGQSTAAPFSETERFYTHVCDTCNATNNILNATWPQFKREWRNL
jgi:hypothetical protein